MAFVSGFIKIYMSLPNPLCSHGLLLDPGHSIAGQRNLCLVFMKY